MDQISLPADIREYDQDEFVIGGIDSADEELLSSDDPWEEDEEDGDESERQLDIDDIFAKSLTTVIGDAAAYYGKEIFDPEHFQLRRASHINPDLTFVTIEQGTLLLDENDKIIGALFETDLTLLSDYQDQGLGREIVIEHFLRSGNNPVWDLDSAQYSEAGYNTFCSAHRFPLDNPAVYVDKLVRLTIMENPALDDQVENIRELLAGAKVADARLTISEMAAEKVLVATPG